MGKFGDACDSFSWFMAGGTDTNTRAGYKILKRTGEKQIMILFLDDSIRLLSC